MVSQYEVDKLKLLFEYPIGCLTKKEAKKIRRREHKQARKKSRAIRKQQFFSSHFS